jgi:hypothetical protein
MVRFHELIKFLNSYIIKNSFLTFYPNVCLCQNKPIYTSCGFFGESEFIFYNFFKLWVVFYSLFGFVVDEDTQFLELWQKGSSFSIVLFHSCWDNFLSVIFSND